MSKEKHRTVEFETGEPDLQNWLTDFSAHINARQEGGKAQLPESFASGFAKVYQVEKGFTFRLVDYKLNNDFVYKSEPAKKYFLILYFYQYSELEYLFFKADDEVVVDSREKNFSSLLMSNSKVVQELRVSNGAHVQGLTIQLTEEWLQEKMSHPETAVYKFLREKKVFQAFLYPKAQRLLHEIFDKNADKVVPGLYYTNRVSRLLEGFLEKILKNAYSSGFLPAAKRDVESLLRIENYLVQNYAGGFPGVEKLARIAFMSPTKLKRIFKRAYGKPLYEYFQKNRMHKAKEYLNSGNYSIAEVAMQIGYQNLSNFSAAFKKEIGCLPKEFIRQEGE